MENKKKGILRKGIGGFYYVETEGIILECKARGIFRKNKISPLAGDSVIVTDLGDGCGSLDEILPRKSMLLRPPVANLDRLFIVASVSEPVFHPFLVDQISAIAVSKGIEPVVLITKTDLCACREISDIYHMANLQCLSFSIEDQKNLPVLQELLKGKISAFTGNSGVGKSTLLNGLFPALKLETGEISRKLGRGRHTTRCVELFPVPGGGYVADTPGFSALELERSEHIPKEKLANCFPEFKPYLGQCKFTSCSHTKEKGCAVLEAVAKGKLSKSRHDSYVTLYENAKEWKEWENR